MLQVIRLRNVLINDPLELITQTFFLTEVQRESPKVKEPTRVENEG